MDWLLYSVVTRLNKERNHPSDRKYDFNAKNHKVKPFFYK